MTMRSSFLGLGSVAILSLAIGACGSGTATTDPISEPTDSTTASSAPASAGGRPVSPTTITVRDFEFDTPDVTVRRPVALAVTNAGPTVHNLTIREVSGTIVGATSNLKTGATETLAPDLPVGSYTIFCSLPGHESLGIKGTLTVAH